MIVIGSKSYPYLAVAQHYGIDYGKVLIYVDDLETRNIVNYELVPLYTDWALATYDAYFNEMDRRKQV